ncbi:MAG TPA: hypothetical protein VIL34_18180 [Actinopolymorphaceae bacterium]
MGRSGRNRDRRPVGDRDRRVEHLEDPLERHESGLDVDPRGYKVNRRTVRPLRVRRERQRVRDDELGARQ